MRRTAGRAGGTMRTTLLLLGVAASGTVTWTACVGDDAAPPADICDSYCAAVARSCTGDQRQYRSDEECKAICAMLPKGSESDGALNTVGCRLRQARAAATREQCTAAGPFGGGVCGSRCESFCAITAQTCGEELGPLQPYRSEPTCLEQCSVFTFDPEEGEGPDQPFAGNDTINCRSYHLVLAISDPEGHCPHVAPTTNVCQGASGGDAGDGGN